MSRSHSEVHRTDSIGWLRAAVPGANDGIVSTASLVIGVAAAGTTQGAVLVAGVAGLVADAMSMAAGEYVSVSSQADTEQADLARERLALASDGAHEAAELAGIYVQRGLDPALAQQVAMQFTAWLAAWCGWRPPRRWSCCRCWVRCRPTRAVPPCPAPSCASPSGAHWRWRSPPAPGVCSPWRPDTWPLASAAPSRLLAPSILLESPTP
jgi:hypothetical protein